MFDQKIEDLFARNLSHRDRPPGTEWPPDWAQSIQRVRSRLDEMFAPDYCPDDKVLRFLVARVETYYPRLLRHWSEGNELKMADASVSLAVSGILLAVYLFLSKERSWVPAKYIPTWKRQRQPESEEEEEETEWWKEGE